jgi:hypothetical protein
MGTDPGLPCRHHQTALLPDSPLTTCDLVSHISFVVRQCVMKTLDCAPIDVGASRFAIWTVGDRQTHGPVATWLSP